MSVNHRTAVTSIVASGSTAETKQWQILGCLVESIDTLVESIDKIENLLESIAKVQSSTQISVEGIQRAVSKGK